jgi:hypothetical protein
VESGIGRELVTYCFMTEKYCFGDKILESDLFFEALFYLWILYCVSCVRLCIYFVRASVCLIISFRKACSICDSLYIYILGPLPGSEYFSYNSVIMDKVSYNVNKIKSNMKILLRISLDLETLGLTVSLIQDSINA